jgi:hypothetical protein
VQFFRIRFSSEFNPVGAENNTETTILDIQFPVMSSVLGNLIDTNQNSYRGADCELLRATKGDFGADRAWAKRDVEISVSTRRSARTTRWKKQESKRGTDGRESIEIGGCEGQKQFPSGNVSAPRLLLFCGSPRSLVRKY